MRLFNAFLPLSLLALAAGCFAPVLDSACLSDSDCAAGPCIDGTCRPDGTVNGGGAGGGAAGGSAGGSAGGQAGGGVAGGTGGGVAGGAGGGNPLCSGCVDASGTCRTGVSDAFCGVGGGACQSCPAGNSCTNGACAPSTCGPLSCGGCCDATGCKPIAVQTAAVCGRFGSLCQDCGTGTCANGACSTGCGPQSCSGCCRNSQCEPGNTPRACGFGGAACSNCGMMGQCQAGSCSTQPPLDGGFPPPSDGGMGPVLAGSPCTSAQQCNPPPGQYCMPESTFGQNTGYTGGYCTSTCGANQPCLFGGECVTETVLGVASSTCHSTCSGAGTGQGTCRSGYVCTALASTGSGYCRPNCNNGALASCPSNTTCGTDGYCH